MKRGASSTDRLSKKRNKIERSATNDSIDVARVTSALSLQGDVSSEEFDTTIVTINHLIKLHLQMDIPESLHLFMVELHRSLFPYMISERLSYQCHLMVLFKRFLKAKWPTSPIYPIMDFETKKIIKESIVKELLKGFIAAVVVSAKMVCDEAVHNDDILAIIKNIHTKQLSIDMPTTKDLHQLEIEFMKALNWETGIIANESQTVMLLYLSKLFNQFCSSSISTMKDTDKSYFLLKENKALFEYLLHGFGRIKDTHTSPSPEPIRPRPSIIY